MACHACELPHLIGCRRQRGGFGRCRYKAMDDPMLIDIAPDDLAEVIDPTRLRGERPWHIAPGSGGQTT